MQSGDSGLVPAVLAITIVLVLILLGPSLFSSYQNWKIKKGLKK
jgi:hypothetical protein